MRIISVAIDSDFQSAFAALAQERTQALIVTASTFYNANISRLVALAARYGIPATYELREFTEAGGLMSYGASLNEVSRQTGLYVGRILKGEKPADLPVLLPSRFEFTLNLKTAKALGLSIPPGVLAIADEVIE
jgi:putative ABC transport system substrate-binding protein